MPKFKTDHAEEILGAVRKADENTKLAGALRDLADALDAGAIYFSATSTTLSNEVSELPMARMSIDFMLRNETGEEL